MPECKWDISIIHRSKPFILLFLTLFVHLHHYQPLFVTNQIHCLHFISHFRTCFTQFSLRSVVCIVYLKSLCEWKILTIFSCPSTYFITLCNLLPCILHPNSFSVQQKQFIWYFTNFKLYKKIVSLCVEL